MSLQGTGVSGLGERAKTIHTSTIGPQKWSNKTINAVKLSQSIVERADRGIEIGKATDPLPTLRDVLNELSNAEIKRYTRDVST